MSPTALHCVITSIYPDLLLLLLLSFFYYKITNYNYFIINIIFVNKILNLFPETLLFLKEYLQLIRPYLLGSPISVAELRLTFNVNCHQSLSKTPSFLLINW